MVEVPADSYFIGMDMVIKLSRNEGGSAAGIAFPLRDDYVYFFHLDKPVIMMLEGGCACAYLYFLTRAISPKKPRNQ